MKYITVPEEIRLTEADGTPTKATISFQHWMCTTVLVDGKLGKTLESILTAADVRRKIQECNGVLELSDTEWALLKDVIKEPTAPYNPAAAVQIVPFFKAFLDASDEK